MNYRSDGDERDYADYDEMEAKRKRRLAYEAAEAAAVTTTTQSSAQGAPLTLEAMEAAIKELGPPPEPQQYIEFDGKRYPIKDFSLQLDPTAPVMAGMDTGTGPDHTVLSVWQREQLKGMFEVKPFECGWAKAMLAAPTEMAWRKYTRQDIRRMRKRARTKADKERVKRIARNPYITELDPRKRKSIERKLKKRFGRSTSVKWHNKTTLPVEIIEK